MAEVLSVSKMEPNTLKMIQDIDEFGFDLSSIQEFLDRKTLKDIHQAIKEYQQNRSGLISNEMVW